MPAMKSNTSQVGLRRTFTLPRNPFGRRRPDDDDADGGGGKRVFRRPSIRRFITRIAQHIGGVPVLSGGVGGGGGGGGEARVPPVGLQTWTAEQTPGVTGLCNHGNTCFINAVVQCVSHTDALAEYFVLDQYRVDLSRRRNKLNAKKYGTKGELTEQLALLLKALWACQYSAELSTNFKQVVERHGAQYKGTQQHDALEFLQWILDKVHEDLNTAAKKKYKSIKTSGRPDEVIAAETLANHIRCNNSFIQAIFQAQYRSSLSCSRCLTQSNTFDPFQCISVQLPQVQRHSVYVTVLYTSQQPRQVQIGVSLPAGATITELREILESDTSIARSNMLLVEINESGFLRTFADAQPVSIITEIDPIYCIEVAQLKDLQDDSTSPYVLLCWINVVTKEDGDCCRFGSPYTMQIPRDTSYEDVQKLMLKEMAPILYDDILTSSQPSGIFKMRISDPAWYDNEPPSYLEPDLEHPLFMEAVDQALALCSEDGGPAHLKLILEWTDDVKRTIIADDSDVVEEHSSVKLLRAQALQGGAPLTLEECLKHYTKAETLTMDDAWRCPHCQQYLPVVKTLDVWSLPDILIVHFKRFRQQTIKGRNSTKLTTMVDFPVHGFDMSPHLASKKHSNGELENPIILGGIGWSPWKRQRKPSASGGDCVYDLYAVCYHHGTDLETGHYTAACRNSYDNQWYLYDDTKVSNLTQQVDDIKAELVNNSAYMLFYQKRNGTYVSSSANSSSAASTSSLGSGGGGVGGDHWVNRMPKFTYTPPKIKTDAKAVKNETTTTNATETNANVNEEATKTPATDCNRPKCTLDVDVKNFKNSLEAVAPPENRDASMTSSLHAQDMPKPPTYTTSIYINAQDSGEVTTTTSSNAMVSSPVISMHRVLGMCEPMSAELDERNGYYKGNRGYGTLTTIHRFANEEEREKCYHSDDEAPPVCTTWVSSKAVCQVSAPSSM